MEAEKSAIEKRMEMPMGEKPAAKVVRRSGRRIQPTPPPPPAPPSPVEPNKDDEPETEVVPVLGDIKERKTARRRKSAQQNKPKSRFAQSRCAAGFPSLDRPLGSLVQHKNSATRKPQPARSTKQVAPPETQPPAKVPDSSIESLQQASAKDASAMLSGMSEAEIQESIQELQSSLDPTTLVFLKLRHGTKQGKHDAANVCSKKEQTSSKERETSGAADEEEQEKAEKERMTQLLSSIRNYEDLDAAYEAHQEQVDNNNFEGKDEFQIACDLLRSTSPQQTLWAARVVSQRLRNDQKDAAATYNLLPRGPREPNPWPYPTLLPVSLRCLLDVNMVSGRTLLQSTYVLQALFSLLQLRACVDHVVDVTCSDLDQSACYQIYCLDDAVPTPPLSSCYASKPIQPVKVDNEGSAYATSSSSTSAQADGESFERDPMWTLLSQMRILPRLAQLLQKRVLSQEALVATCGILAMIGQRSPGAATAIVQHPTMLDDLISVTLTPKEGSAKFDTSLALPTIVLMCTLARQSRATAECLSDRITQSSFLLQLLTANTDIQLQQWTLILWRTLLRYGLGLAMLPSILSLAATPLTLGMNGTTDQCQDTNAPCRSISAELYSAFSAVLQCVQASQMQRDAKAETTTSQDGNKKDVAAFQEEARVFLSNAGTWLSSTKQQAFQHLKNIETSPEGQCLQDCESLRYTTGILRYLLEHLAVVSNGSPDSLSGEFKAEDMSISDEEIFVSALTSIVQSESIHTILQTVLQYARITDFHDASVVDDDPTAVKFEACSASFLDALLTLITVLLKRSALSVSEQESELNQKIELLSFTIRDLLTTCLKSNLKATKDGLLSPTKTILPFGAPRRLWLNRAHAAIVSFFHETNSRNLHLSRELAFTVIGRLECGDESMAATLFSYNELTKDESSINSRSPSPVSTILIRELCRTSSGRHQLDHSFLLRNGLGIDAQKGGPFSLQSLLSVAENPGPGDDTAELLPIGPLWLWQMLSGSVIQSSIQGELESEATQVLSSALQIISELERSEGSYASRLNVGAKLYYLVNICFHPEAILSCDKITAVASAIFDGYFLSLYPGAVQFFGRECLAHLSKSSNDLPQTSQESPSPAEQEQVRSILEPEAPPGSDFAVATVRSLEALVSDLCDIFMDYGAQYSFFRKCVRLFLTSGFPTKVRCEVVQRLRGGLHLLGLEEDGDNTVLLRQCLSGGLPAVDNSVKDPPELIDAVSSFFCKGSFVRHDASFFSSWGTALLARSFAISLTTGDSSGLSVSKRRIQRLETDFAERVLDATALFLETKGTLDDLVRVAYTATSEVRTSVHCDLSSVGLDDGWELIVDWLCGIKKSSL